VSAAWYVIHTFSGQEARAKQSLLERAKQFNREGALEEIVIPEEDVVEVVKGQRRTSKRKFLPGYLHKHELNKFFHHHPIKDKDRSNLCLVQLIKVRSMGP